MSSGIWLHRYLVTLSILAVLFVIGLPVLAQATAPYDEPAEQADLPPDAATPVPAHASRSAATAHAWQILEDALQSSKAQVRISAVTAMGTIWHSKEAALAIEKALTDPDRDVRLAAVHAAAALKTPLLIPALRKSLDDSAPDISFAASEVLWGMNDHSGQEILIEVLAGERKGAPGFFKAGLHTANKDLHSPSTLAIIGAEQGAYALMGPFGVGLDAARLMVKNNDSANSARVAAVMLLSSDKSMTTNNELIAALKDKDYFVRAAAARGLGDFHNDQSADALLAAFEDPKPLVRCMAAAGYIRSSAKTGRSKPRLRTRHTRVASPSTTQ